MHMPLLLLILNEFFGAVLEVVIMGSGLLNSGDVEVLLDNGVRVLHLAPGRNPVLEARVRLPYDRLVVDVALEHYLGNLLRTFALLELHRLELLLFLLMAGLIE